MIYRKVVFRQIPRIIFAHLYQSEHYHLEFPREENSLEISAILRGDILKTMEDQSQFLIPAPSLAVTFRDQAYAMKSRAPLHSHVTVGLTGEFEARPVTREEVVAFSHEAFKQHVSHCLTAIVPDVLPLWAQYADLENNIRRIIHVHNAPGSAGNLHCTGLLFSLLARITDICVFDAMAAGQVGLAPGSLLYAQQAAEYIAQRGDKKITVSELAAHVGISSGYLSHLFKSVTGQSIVEYIHRLKLERVKELITNKHITLREAGEAVGIEDENYLSRLFKKYTGLTARKYLKLKRF